MHAPSSAPAAPMSYRSISLWMDQVADDLRPRPALDGDVVTDVAIVGAGYTGLWTAYYILQADPRVRVALIEAKIAGYGASGRNGGWCSALFAASKERIARLYGRRAAVAMQRAMMDTVDEVARVVRCEGIEAGFVKGGTLTLATSPAHVSRIKAHVAAERSWGMKETDIHWLDAAETSRRIAATGCLGAAFTPHCARIQPASLARGLARAVERHGGRLYEQTLALDMLPGMVRTPGGRVRADVVVRATEAYAARLPGLQRSVVPLYSLMIATEPLPPTFWEQVGWSGYETINDGRRLLIYAQRTHDDRIAIGGRGAPYHFGSRMTDRYEQEPDVFAALHAALTSLFPGARQARITHRWGGALAAPRDWFSSVGFDAASGTAWAGGYVGDGVATANLAGRTLADLILGNSSDLLRLPWVNHRSRRWEPEPLRWMGVNLALKAMRAADESERRSGKPARRADFVMRFTQG